ncbi:hypothetical protein C8Q78DRAFT_1023172, partial [Trametes maxima]
MGQRREKAKRALITDGEGARGGGRDIWGPGEGPEVDGRRYLSEGEGVVRGMSNGRGV